MLRDFGKGPWHFSHIEVLGSWGSGATGPLPTYLLCFPSLGKGCMAGFHEAHKEWPLRISFLLFIHIIQIYSDHFDIPFSSYKYYTVLLSHNNSGFLNAEVFFSCFLFFLESFQLYYLHMPTIDPKISLKSSK